MSDRPEDNEPTPLEQAFRQARRVAGKVAVHKCLVAHGAKSGLLPDVPAARHDACLRALRKLANGGGVDSGTKAEAAFADLHKKAYGERPTPPRAIDEAAIYERWNRVKAKPADV